MAIRLLIRKSLYSLPGKTNSLEGEGHIYNNGLASLMMKMNTEPVTPATGREGFTALSRSRLTSKEMKNAEFLVEDGKEHVLVEK